MNLGAQAGLSIDFGRGPATVHFHVGSVPDYEPADVAIRKVEHLGADITDELTQQERETILDKWRLKQ